MLRFGDGWVSLPPVEARITGALVDRFGAVVRPGRARPAGWPDGAPGRNALDVHVLRIRRRLAPLGLAIRTVRSRGYLLETVDVRCTSPQRRGNDRFVTPATMDALWVDKGAGRAGIGVEALRLTPSELSVLAVLADAGGRVVPQDRAGRGVPVWSACRPGAVSRRWWVSATPSAPTSSVNVRGRGWRLAMPATTS